MDMNDVSYDVDRSTDIYSTFKADKHRTCMGNSIRRQRAFRVLGEDLA